MPRIHHSSLEVRGYELDSYGHVNNAVYLSYLEYGRWQMLKEAGIARKELDQIRIWPVVSSIEIKYLRPAYMDQKLEIQTQITERKRTFFWIDQTIFHERNIVAKARVQLVFVDEKGKPTAYPPQFEPLWADEGASAGSP